MIDLLIIADDFTGALDTGVQFSKKGIKTLVTTDLDIDFTLLRDDIHVLAINTETRHISPHEAHEVVARLTQRAVGASVRCIYKKTDSTLRGNIGAELSAMLKHADANELMFVPAFPKNLRITMDAVQYVDGVPLAETSFASDPIDPVSLSNVADIIATQSSVPVFPVCVEDYDRALTTGYDERCICLFDAASDDDLSRLAQALHAHDKLTTLAGCAGFAEYIPHLLGLTAQNIVSPTISGSILLVTGSVNQVSLDQVQEAEALGYHTVTMTPSEKLGRTPEDARNRMIAANRVIDMLSRGQRTVLASIINREDLQETDDYARTHGIAKSEVSRRVAKSIGEVVGAVASAGVVQNLIVFGGDTLLSIMEAIHCSRIIPVREVAPGIVEAKLLCPGAQFTVISKAGGFGSADVIASIEAFFAIA